MYKFEIEDYYELLNLHKAIIESKFHKNPDNISVCFSPIIAKISNDIVDILIKMEEEKDESKVEKWKEWRKLENQTIFRNQAIENACTYTNWHKLSYEKKLISCRNLMSPFYVSDSEIETIINEIDKKISN